MRDRTWGIRPSLLLSLAALAAVAILEVAACSATSDNTLGEDGVTNTNTNTGGDIGFDGGAGGGGLTGDPQTCADAALVKSYIGCDFWPTVTANNVWSIFDFAVVVANAGQNVVDASVTRAGVPVPGAQTQIQPNSLATIYLPWVPELKGPDADQCGSATPLTTTVRALGGAYHLTTTFPVTVYQFNALEYRGAGGPPNKSWAGCPGDLPCGITPIGCFSFSNDASLLLPSTALTGNFRVAGYPGWATANIGSYIAVTGTQDGTNVTLHLSPTASVVAGGGLTASGPGGTASFPLAAGEVVEVLGPPTGDFSGTWVEATKPVQVITGLPCINIPEETGACDHIEESVFPAETLGQHYLVVRPAGPNANMPGHVVRLYGNVNGTTLTYPSGAPPGAPSTISAGQVVDLGQVAQDFEVVGSAAFAVGTFLLGAGIVDPLAEITAQKGDPAQSLATAVEQYRLKYVFLAPIDYDVNYVNIILPTGTSIFLDGAALAAAGVPIGASGYSVARVVLGPGQMGAHVLEASAPVGIQVEGYGAYTSYYYPGGLDLNAIAPPPVE
jgi:hypothetical protein